MTRFAPIQTSDIQPNALGRGYRYGFSKPTTGYAFMSQPGLSQRTVEEISAHKEEPRWMLEKRLEALKIFEEKPTPMWGGDLTMIDYDAIRYYLRPTEGQGKRWQDVPVEIKDTFDRLGIPQAERKMLSGVKAQYDCLTADSVVFMNQGVKKIVDVNPGEFVYSLNEHTGRLERQRIVGLVAKGERKIFKVITQGGREIKVTGNHPFLSLVHYKKPGKRRGRYRKEWRYLCDLKAGGLVALTVNFPDNGNSYKLPAIQKPAIRVSSHNQFGTYDLNTSHLYADVKFPVETSEDLMWLLGFYLGDGFCGGKRNDGTYGRVELAIPRKEQQLRLLVSRLVKDLFGYDLVESGDDRVSLNSVLFVQLIEKLGFSGSAYTKRIPRWVFSLPRIQRLAFIGGYFDADGTIRNSPTHKNLVFTSVSREILEDLKLLAISCGLNPSHIWEFNSKQLYKSRSLIRRGFRLQISGAIQEVGSRMQRKRRLFGQRRFIHRFKTAQGTDFRKHTSDHIGFAKILSIEELGVEPVYDIEVEGFHNFVANGLVVHNSEVVYGSLKNQLKKQGVLFLGMDEGLREHPDLVRQYFGKLIPAGDNKFAALNSAVWSGGSFVYVPKGVEVKLPLQAYFRINAALAGQFERTLIIADEGAKVHYVEGCFTAGTLVSGNSKPIAIERVQLGDRVLTHRGVYRRVNYVQKRKHTGTLFTVEVWGDASLRLEVTDQHPFWAVRRNVWNERNRRWRGKWTPVADLVKGDYVAIPVNRQVVTRKWGVFEIDEWRGRRRGFVQVKRRVPSVPEFFRLAGYYLAEGSISSGAYLTFSFSEKETTYVQDVQRLMMMVFGVDKSHINVHRKNHGVSLVFNSTELCRVFAHLGKKSYLKRIPDWLFYEAAEKQRELIVGLFRGDGNYYDRLNNHGRKDIFRVNSTSAELARQVRDILLRLGIVSFINRRDRSREDRRVMYTVGVTGQHMIRFGALVGIQVDVRMNGKKRASMFGFDGSYAYLPIKKITKQNVHDVEVYNFGVEEDESYVAGGMVVHNCTAPAYSSESLHAAVVEIFVKKGAKVQYTTVQNWYKTVYNLVTKRAWVEEEGEMVWTDFNMGSKLTMKYPSFFLAGKGARGETLSMALAGAGQHQDAGSKAYHLAPHTTSTIISKSISKNGGRTTYRGMVSVGPNARGSKSKVVCDALLLDEESRSDTYPTNRILTNDVSLEHEATVSKIGEEKLFYLMSRGLTEEEASKMIVSGFVEPLIKKLPLEYAVEMNRLIDMEMEGSVG